MEQVRNVDHSVNDPLNQGQTFLVSSRTFRAFVPRPHGHPEICPERSTADRNHLVDQVKINHGVNNLFMTPDSVTAHGDTCPDLVLEDLWILRYQGSTAIENRLELSTDLPLIAGTPHNPRIRPFHLRVQLEEGVLVHATFLLPDAIVAMYAKLHNLPPHAEILYLGTVVLPCVAQRFIDNKVRDSRRGLPDMPSNLTSAPSLYARLSPHTIAVLAGKRGRGLDSPLSRPRPRPLHDRTTQPVRFANVVWLATIPLPHSSVPLRNRIRRRLLLPPR